MLYPSFLEEVTERQLRLLCIAACSGKFIDAYNIGNIAKRLKCTTDDIKKELEKLYSTGGLAISSGYFFIRNEKEYRISNTYQVRVLHWMYKNHCDWTKKIYIGQSDDAEELCQVVEAVVKGKAKRYNLEADYAYTENLTDALSYVIDEEEFLPIFRNMDDFVLFHVLKTLHSRCNNTCNKLAFRSFLEKIFDESNKERCKIIQPYYDFFRINDYIENGNYVELTKDETTEHGLMMKAISEAYARHIPKALSYLEKALKEHNKTAGYNTDKNVLDGHITNFYMMLIYALDGSVTSKKKLEIAVKKKTICENIDGYPSLVLGTYFKDAQMNILKNELTKCIVEKNTNKISNDIQQMAFLLMKYFELSKNEMAFNRYYQAPDLSPERYIPQKALLRHELSPYLPISDEEKAILREKFGGEPLLATIHRKKKWEVVLEELLEIASQDDANQAPNTSEHRITYILRKNSDYVDVREQKRLKNGEWSVGKLHNPTSYRRGDFEMDDKDREIWMSSKSLYNMPSASIVIPLMVGTNRVMLDVPNGRYGTQCVEAEVREEKPFITVEREGKHIVLKTNLPSLALIDRSIAFHIDWNNFVVTYYPMNDREKMYFRRLFSLTDIPIEAEETLKKLFPAISNKVEVHSEFIEGGTQLEQVEGRSIITLRIIPRIYGQYLLSMFVTPIEEKILRLHDAKRNLATSLLKGTDTSHKITASQLLKMIEEG